MELFISCEDVELISIHFNYSKEVFLVRHCFITLLSRSLGSGSYNTVD